MSNLLAPLNSKGLVLLLVFLAVQFLFLALTLSNDESGLEWSSRRDDCPFSTGSGATDVKRVETFFFRERLCQEVDDARTCEDYDEISGTVLAGNLVFDNEKLDDADDDFGAASGLTATCLTLTIIAIIAAVVSLRFGNKVLFCMSDSIIFKSLLLAIYALSVLFIIAAAGVASNSDALKESLEGCDRIKAINGYGVNICAILVFWILAQVGLVLYPPGPCLGYETAEEGASVSFQEKELAPSPAGSPDASFAARPSLPDATEDPPAYSGAPPVPDTSSAAAAEPNYTTETAEAETDTSKEEPSP